MSRLNTSVLLLVTILMISYGFVNGQESNSVIESTTAVSTTAVSTTVATPCSIDQTFSPQATQSIFPFECQIGPDYNQFYMNYSYGGSGASAYILTEPQYDAYLENVKKDPNYVPPDFGDYFIFFYTPNFGYSSSNGYFTSKVRSDFGKVRMLVKQNPTFKGQKSGISIKLTMIPQYDNSETITIIGVAVGGVFGLLCCVGCIGILIFLVVRRRKASYTEVI